MKTFTSGLTMRCLLAVMIACCMMVISTGAAFAASVDEMHQEVDQFLFEQHNGDFSEQGFTITHTAPINNMVEIGITPYKEEYAAYLYNILGDEMVKVVEGQQAVTLASPTISNAVVTQSAIVDNEAKTIAYQEPATSSNSNSLGMGSIIAALIIIGGIVLALGKRRARGNKL